jgi:Peptidase S24-like
MLFQPMPPAAAHDAKLSLALDLLRSSHPIHVRATGTSMLPSIWPGDVLSIENCSPGDVSAGDIIRFMQNGRFVIHRVVAIQRQREKLSWITRGDAVACDDGLVPAEDFLGRVSAIRRNSKSIQPGRHLSSRTHWFGRMLIRVHHIQGVVLRVRAVLRRTSAISSYSTSFHP